MKNIIDLTGDKFELWADDVTGALEDFIALTDNMSLDRAASSPHRDKKLVK